MTDRQIDDVKYTGNRAEQEKIQTGAKDNKSPSTTSPANIEPAGKPKP
jgi:hypothetical protein